MVPTHVTTLSRGFVRGRRANETRLLLPLSLLALVLVGTISGVGTNAGGHDGIPGRAPLDRTTLGGSTAGTVPGAPRPSGSGPTPVAGATVLRSVAVKSQPTTATYDSQDHDVYVTNFGSPSLGGNSVSIFADSNGTVLRTVAVGDDPLTSVYDPADGDVYVLNFGTSNNLTVFHGTSIVKWIPSGGTPAAGLYDPDNQYVYISCQGSSNLTVLNGTKTVGAVSVGSVPGNGAFDNRTGWLYVPNVGSNNVSIVNGTSVVSNVSVGQSPTQAIYDPDNGWVYVPNPGSDTVSILNGTSVVATVPGGGTPTFGAYDPTNGWIYLADGGSNTVYILNGTSFVANISAGIYPRSAAFDPADGYIYVPNWASDTVTVINSTTVVASATLGNNPYGLTYDPDVSSMYVVNFNSNNLSQVGTPQPSYPVTFAETGLPLGTNWTVECNSTYYDTSNTEVAFPEANGTYNYTASTVPGFSSPAPSGSLSVTGGPVQVNISFAPAYPVTFQESGLPPGTFWSVMIGTIDNGTGNGSLQLFEPNGTFLYTVEPVVGFQTTWTGHVTVAGAGRTVAVPFSTSVYSVEFNETGLPVGTTWGATLGNTTNSSTNASFGIDQPNGSYLFTLSGVAGYTGTPSEGYVSVAGVPSVVRVSFIRTYGVTFVETGLPAETTWTVTFGSGPVSTMANNVTVNRSNGTYSYALASSVFQYAPVAPRGTFNVTGAPTTVDVVFAARTTIVTTFWVYFVETGLSGPVTWNVSVGNQTNRSANSTIGFEVTNATYNFTVTAPGYVATPARGTLVADAAAGLADPVRIAFHAFSAPSTPTYPIQFAAAGLPASARWHVSIGSAVASGVSSTLVLDEPNGTYGYSVGPVAGLTTNTSGTVTVSGGPADVVVTFHSYVATVVFREVGLPSGTGWNVSFASFQSSSTGATVVFAVPNGTYSFSVGTVAGYSGTSTGSVVVNGSSPTVVVVTFGPVRTPATTVFGLPPLEAVALAAGAAVLLLVVGLLLPTGRSAPPPAEDDATAVTDDDLEALPAPEESADSTDG
jgi:YVTN family beta-propeller protein